MTSEELKFLMMAFDHIQTVKANNPSDPNLPEIESLFYKHAPDYFSFQTLRLSDMYEMSFEKKIEKQASTFYDNFGHFSSLPTDIRKQLFSDYCQMELQRRRDNFERFSQCVFQQIECITTQYWKNGKLFKEIENARELFMYATRFPNATVKANNQPPRIQNIIFNFRKEKAPFNDIDYSNYFLKKPKHTDANIHFRTKVNALLYFVCFNSKPLFDEYHNLNRSINQLYAVRNLFHRGPENFTQPQQTLLQEIRQNQPVYFLKFYGLLSEFMHRVFNSKNLNKII